MEGDLSLRLRELIKELGMNQTTFAQKTGNNAKNISNAVKGTTNPSLGVLLNIFDTFPNLNANWLMCGTEPKWLNEDEDEDKRSEAEIELERCKTELEMAQSENYYLKQEVSSKDKIIELLERNQGLQKSS